MLSVSDLGYMDLDSKIYNWHIGFHDCVGGCDGCIDHDNGSNAGLAEVDASLIDLYNSGGYSVSLADFYAFASTVAVDVAIIVSMQSILTMLHLMELKGEELFFKNPTSVNCCGTRALVYAYRSGYIILTLFLLPMAFYITNPKMRREVFENFNIYLPRIFDVQY